MSDNENIKELQVALKSAAKVYEELDPKIGLILSLDALFRFSEPYIKDESDLKPYHDLTHSLLQVAEGFSSELLAPREKPNNTRQSIGLMMGNARAASEVGRLMSHEKLTEEEASKRVCRSMARSPSFTLSAEQICNLRDNLTKGNKNKIQTDLFNQFVSEWQKIK